MIGPYQDIHDCPTGHHDSPSINCYNHQGCRCHGCAREKREAQRQTVEKKKGQEPPEHGLRTHTGRTAAAVTDARKFGGSTCVATGRIRTMADRDEPTEAQQAILDAIRSHVDDHGWAPSIAELAVAVYDDEGARSTVHYHLQRLEEAGWIRRKAGASRALTVVDRDDEQEET